MRHAIVFAALLLLLPIAARSAPIEQAATHPEKADGDSLIREHQGFWLGDLTFPNGHSVKVGLELFTRADGSVWASYASPGRGSYDIPVDRISETGGSVDLDLSFASMKLSWTGDHFSGQWKQNGDTMPVELRPVAAFPRKHRIQTPTPPFPYHDQTLAIASVKGVTLGATLTVPNGTKRPDLVVLVHGSGPQTRDEEGDGHATFAVLADQLARRGLAVLRYDKRGISRSTGDYEASTPKDLADDLTAVAQAMRARRQFARVGLVGHSEGPMIAAAVAARHPESVDFIVSLAGVGLPGVDMMLLQDRAYAKDQGAGPADAERLLRYARRYYETIVQIDDPDTRVSTLKKLREGLPADDRALIAKYKMNEGSLSLENAASPELRALLMSNPQKDWRAVRCPVLALNGDLDHQVPVESLGGIVAALHAGGNGKVESAVLPGINHMFQTARTGTEEEYSTIDETVAPVVASRIAAFVQGQVDSSVSRD